MTDDFGVDLEEVFKVIGAADVLVVRFQLIEPRLLVDFRTKEGAGPHLALVPRAESVEDRFRSIRRLRPGFPFPEKVMSFHWPRSTSVLQSSGVWNRIVERVSALGGIEATERCGHIMEQLLVEERREINRAIRGSDKYQTLWERSTA
ncbi:MAG: hypothetical protein ACE5EF_01370 [Dehalococcoidia bacterium]